MADNKNQAFLSIIIPTLNEADFLGYLLFSLSRQTYKNFEIIVSDGDSNDQTIEIAEKFRTMLPSLKTIVSKKQSPSKQRNQGVKIALYEKLLFLDADVILPPNFLEENIKEMAKKKLKLAQPFYLPIGGKISDQYISIISRFGIKALRDIFPVGLGWALFSTKTIHNKLNGFDENMQNICEDGDYIFRAVREGEKFNLLNSCPGFVSMRRYESKGRIKEVMFSLRAVLLISLLGKHEAQRFIKRSYGNLLMVNVEKFLNQEISKLVKDFTISLKKHKK